VRIRLADVEPSPDAFAAVMATGVLSIVARDHHYRAISDTLGVLATVVLLVLVILVLVTGAIASWDLRDPDVTLRLFTFVAALCVYGLMTWLNLWRAVIERQNFVPKSEAFEPDSWILIGGLAIATLAGDNIHSVAPAWLAGPVLALTVATWVAATLWIPPSIYFGLHRIRQGPDLLRFAGVWWALVFPLGMYAAASYAMAAEIGRGSLITVSLVFFWDALAAWLIVVVAGLLRLSRGVVSGRPNGDAGRP
jgi:Voltage-dependent anion channel